MGETAIEWTDRTWNWAQGCTKVDGDCKFCYMFRDKERYGQDPSTVVRSKPATFNGILNAKKYPPGSLVFTNSWSDWWHPDCDEWRADAWVNVALRPDLTFQVLTKRPERIAGTLSESWGPDGWPNVWLGTSIGSPRGADRVRALADIPAVVRFLSIEPLWAPGVAASIRDVVASGRIDWIILGGESGPHARPMHPAWAREVRDLAAEFGVPLLFKQWGEFGHSGQIIMGDESGRLVFREFTSYQHWVAKARSWLDRQDTCLDSVGRELRVGADFMRARDEGTFPVTIMSRVGKKAAGRILDGVIHDAYPTPRVVA